MNKSGSLACHVNHSNDGINFFSADTNIAGKLSLIEQIYNCENLIIVFK
jgi:hypothetical protein